MQCLGWCDRLQASSHILIAFFELECDQPVAARLLVMAVVQVNAQSENQKPLTLALSRRERGLTVVFGRRTPPEIPSRMRILNGAQIGSLSLGRGPG